MGIYNKFLDFIGIEEAEDKQEGDLFEEDVAPEKEPSGRRRPLLDPEPKKSAREPRLQGGGETVPMPNVAAMKMIVYHPVSYEETDSYQVMSMFINHREQVIRKLLEEQ